MDLTAILNEARADVAAATDPEMRAWGNADLGLAFARAGNEAEAEIRFADAEQALAAVERATDRKLAEAHLALRRAQANGGKLPPEHERAKKLVQSIAGQQLVDFLLGVEQLDAAAKAAKKVRDRTYRVMSMGDVVGALVWGGRSDDARALVAEMEELVGKISPTARDGEARPLAEEWLGYAYAAVGRHDDAARLLEPDVAMRDDLDELSESTRHGVLSQRDSILGIWASNTYAGGDRERAEVILGRVSYDRSATELRFGLAVRCAHHGREDEARAMLETAVELRGAELDGDLDLMRTEGETRYLLGEVEEGTRLLDAALEGTEWEEYGGIWNVGRVARAWLDLGDVERAFAAARRIPPKKRSMRGSLMAELVALRLGTLGVTLG